MKTLCGFRVVFSFLLIVLTGCEPGVDTSRDNPSDIVSVLTTPQNEVDTEDTGSMVFPRDHGPHNDYAIEWWHVFADLTSQTGSRYGVQLTFFRRKTDLDSMVDGDDWATNQLYMAHFAVSDVQRQLFASSELLQRASGVGLAGAKANGGEVWLNNWKLSREPGDSEVWVLEASSRGYKFALHLDAGGPPILQGEKGSSFKGDGMYSSRYYSIPRLNVHGTIIVGNQAEKIDEGIGWIDREWTQGSANSDFNGWYWSGLWLDNGDELTFFKTFSDSGSHTYLARSSASTIEHLSTKSLRISEDKTCNTSIGISYTCGITIAVDNNTTYTLIPVLDQQYHKEAFKYWEGLVDVVDKNDSRIGSGYFENTYRKH